MTSIQIAQERRIIDPILERLHELKLVNLQFAYQKAPADAGIDGLITIGDVEYPLEIKGQVQMSMLPKLLEQKKAYPKLILAAQEIPEKVKIALKEQQFNYVDASGNLFLNDLPRLYLFNESKNKKQVPLKNKDLAFTKKGLIVVFHLLSNPELINEPQRTIQQVSTTSLDTVNKVFASLKAQGFIRKKNEKEFRLDQKRNLFLKWIDAYEQRLKPSLFVGRYRFQTIEKERAWDQIELKEASFWGGEPGSDLLTNYLQPAVFQLYSTETKMDLMKNYRFIPDPKGNIYVHVPFGENLVTVKRTNPLLVYADLVNSASYRNLEVAQKVDELYVQKILE
ncbi:MAG: type IV toxin-antitoxin system AbiEi family antitoxin [Haliscomenobacter sp.]|uniref:type IV toxin-antitoxin system AbiEi family antitoxin n=1 Tax=Haliscomenobacter sp. TaxID=2717303 RepID=UPI0029A5AA52|nr:type IV toxin-antitoxin system AbiEi family antitoxin [Haliscomenobacter sp.]MDX2072343.1 type IV toxin-antitoxin system AbiEi family antitoxin [Haliscomenobacter sp.]